MQILTRYSPIQKQVPILKPFDGEGHAGKYIVLTPFVCLVGFFFFVFFFCKFLIAVVSQATAKKQKSK